MGKLRTPFNKDWISADFEQRNSTIKIENYFCPLCTDEKGHFATVKLFLDRNTNLMDECQCNGQMEKCVVLQILKASYNAELLRNK